MADIDPNIYNSRFPTWCKACGNFGIWGAIKNALAEQGISSSQALVVYDIGCSGNMADFLKILGVHSLHGRAIALAVGAHLASHNLPVLAVGGDGGIYGEGVEHLIEACRANFNITVLVHNNGLYSLTAGQQSPTSETGKKTKSTPFGVIEAPFQPLKTAIVHDAGFVARGFAGDIPQLTELIKAGMEHPGFALIDILQPCPTFNGERSLAWFKERVVKLEGAGLKTETALARLDKEPEELVTGVLYRSNRPPYHAKLPQLKSQALVEQEIAEVDIKDLIESMR